MQTVQTALDTAPEAVAYRPARHGVHPPSSDSSKDVEYVPAGQAVQLLLLVVAVAV